jgi:hypothetical protein
VEVVLGDPQVGRWHLFHCADCFLFTSTRNHLLPNQAQSHGLLAWPWPGEHPGQNEASLLAWPGWPAGLRPGWNNTTADASTRNTSVPMNVTDAGDTATTTSTIRKGKHKERPIVLSDIEGNESPLTNIGEDQTTPKKRKTNKSKASEKGRSRKSTRSRK